MPSAVSAEAARGVVFSFLQEAFLRAAASRLADGEHVGPAPGDAADADAAGGAQGGCEAPDAAVRDASKAPPVTGQQQRTSPPPPLPLPQTAAPLQPAPPG